MAHHLLQSVTKVSLKLRVHYFPCIQYWCGASHDSRVTRTHTSTPSWGGPANGADYGQESQGGTFPSKPAYYTVLLYTIHAYIPYIFYNFILQSIQSGLPAPLPSCSHSRRAYSAGQAARQRGRQCIKIMRASMYVSTCTAQQVRRATS